MNITPIHGIFLILLALLVVGSVEAQPRDGSRQRGNTSSALDASDDPWREAHDRELSRARTTDRSDFAPLGEKIRAWELFLRRWPQSPNRAEAEGRLEHWRFLQAFERVRALEDDPEATEQQRLDAWEDLLSRYPAAREILYATDRQAHWARILEDREYRIADRIDRNPARRPSEKADAWRTFLARWPSSIHAERARERLFELENLTIQRSFRDGREYLEVGLEFGVKLEFVKIPEGSFRMGASEREPHTRNDERPQFHVDLSTFWMMTTEVSQAQWRAVMGSVPVEHLGNPRPVNFHHFVDDDLPALAISWTQANEFARRVNNIVRRHGANLTIALPTEAQWEYACRAGTTTPYHFDLRTDDVDQYASYSWNSQGRPHPVGSRQPNAFGLHDMHGNAQEWVADWYAVYPRDSQRDYTGPQSGRTKVLRGGSWQSQIENLRSARREHAPVNANGGDFGFRLAANQIPGRPLDDPTVVNPNEGRFPPGWLP